MNRRRAISKGVLVGCACCLGGLVVVTVAAFMVLGFMITTGRIPDSAAVPGDELQESVISLLREEGVLGENEQVLYYYSDGMFSFREGGNFFTGQRVVSYWLDNGEISTEEATYPEIEDITAEYDDSLFADSSIWVERVEGEAFYLFVSNESDLDEKFIELLIETWTENR